MKTMKVMRFNDSFESPALLAGSAPIPRPGRGELLIRVHAAGVTPTEVHWYPTTHQIDGSARTGAIVGHEFSGTVEAVGADVDTGKIGAEVFGMNDWFADGATADYCLTTATAVVEKPSRLSHVDAASVPIGSLTAWQGLFDRAKLLGGERVLVHGGSGAVGVFAIQFARRTGAEVITTASARDAAFLLQLGADQVIDYKSAHFEEHVSEVDVVFDGVGGGTLERSWQVLKPTGRLVTIAADSEGTADDRTKAAFFIVEPNSGQLKEIAGLLERGELKATVGAIVPFSGASTAYFGTAGHPKGPGKRVIEVVG